jgi:hypothetical protein
MDLDPFTSKFFTSLLLGKPESPIHNQLRPLTQQERELLKAKKEDKEKRNTMMKKIITAMRTNQ